MIERESAQQVAAAVDEVFRRRAERRFLRWSVAIVSFIGGLGIAILLMVPWDQIFRMEGW